MENKSITHVDRINSLSKLKNEGFEGIDSSLEESLFEYGLIWKDCGEQTLFIYKISNGKFDRAFIQNNMKIQRM